MADAIEPVRSARARTERLDEYGLWVRRAALLVMTAVFVAALFNVFGQRDTTHAAATAAASLSLRAPTVLRGGLLYQVLITVTAHEELPKAELALGSGWFSGLTLNTEEPGASSETSGPGGSVDLSIGTLHAGQTYVQYLDFQVNPTSVGHRHQLLALRSNNRTVLSTDHRLTIAP